MLNKCPYERNSFIELEDCDLKIRIGRRLGETVIGVVFDSCNLAKNYWILRVQFEGKKTLTGVLADLVRRTDKCIKRAQWE